MAGTYANVEIDDDDTRDLLSRLLEFGPQSGPDFLKDAGEMLLNSTRDRARNQVDPDGIPWVRLSDVYAASKSKKKPGLRILQLGDHLLNDMLSYQLDGDTALDLGTNAVWGAVHQFGQPRGASGRTKKSNLPIPFGDIPARPFLGFSERDAESLIQILDAHLQSAIDGE